MERNLKIYVVRDNVANDVVSVNTATTDGMFVRTYAKSFQSLNPNFLTDFEIYQVGSVNFDTFECRPCDKRKVSWDSYKMPETTVDLK
nr:MAG TPA: hypothetical protein [Microviridae sp.]